MLPAAMNKAQPSSPRRLDLLLYSSLAFPLAFAGLPVYLHAPDFYAREIGISLISLGSILLLLRLVDAVQDPLIGIFSDRWHRHRRVLLLFGMGLMAVGFWMLFHPHADWPLAWFAISVFLCTTGFSVVNINFHALGGLWQVNTHQRTSVSGWREALGLLGLLAAAVAPQLLDSDRDPAGAFHTMTMLYPLLVLLCAWLFFDWLRRVPLQAVPAVRVAGGLRAWFSPAWKRHLFGLYFFSSLATSIPAVLVIFFIRDRLGASAWLGLLLLLYFSSAVCFIPLWQRGARLFGKCRCWALSMGVAIFGFGLAALLGEGDALWYAPVCVLAGMAWGADLALPPAILADLIAREKEQAWASRNFSVMGFLTKSSVALATGILLPLLGLLGYTPGMTDPAVTVYLSLSYAVVPSLIKVVVLLWLWRVTPMFTPGPDEKNQMLPQPDS